jgi:hypothetical protein
MPFLHSSALFPFIEELQQLASPFMELDPQRGIKTEAALSHRSRLAPYGKIVGIRRTSDKAFKIVHNWSEVEDFILGIADDRVLVKVAEAWGTTYVIGVTVNRAQFPTAVSAAPKTTEPMGPLVPGAAEPEMNLVPILSRQMPPVSTPATFRVGESPRAIAPMIVASALAPGSAGKKSETISTNSDRLLELGMMALQSTFGSAVMYRRPAKNSYQVRIAPTPKASHNIGAIEGIGNEDKWFQECLDLADRLGLLAAKPVITSDRRQRAFALYTLYMALKDLRAQVNAKAMSLKLGLAELAAHDRNREKDHLKLVDLARSMEGSLAAIQQWDTESMARIVIAYRAELKAMDNTRQMLSFLTRVKDSPFSRGVADWSVGNRSMGHTFASD